MPKKSPLGGSTEESASTKPQKSTTRKTKKPPLMDEFTPAGIELWKDVQLDVLNRTIDFSAPYIRSSNPRSPEDKTWWDMNGPHMVSDWLRFRNFSTWQIWTTPDGRKAVEVEISIPVGDTYIKMVIDRIMVTPMGELVVVDLKTGKRTPTTYLQLAVYKYGIKKQFNVDVATGYYWMARQSAMSDPVDLTFYTDDKIEYMLTAFDAARKAQSYIPNTSNCNMCGYTQSCIWYKGDSK